MENQQLTYPAPTAFKGSTAQPANWLTIANQRTASERPVDGAEEQNDDEQVREFYLYLPPILSAQQCTRARGMLGWSQEALAFRSGVSVRAIEPFELEARELREITRQALAYALEREGLLFFVGHKPIKGNGCPGPTFDPRQRADAHLIE